jgi:hypothetical protein
MSFVVPLRYVMDDDQEMLFDYSVSHVNLGDRIEVKWDNSAESMKGKVRQIFQGKFQTWFNLPVNKCPPGYYDPLRDKHKVAAVLFTITFAPRDTIFHRRLLALKMLKKRNQQDSLRRVILGHIPARSRPPKDLIADATYSLQTKAGTKLTFEATPRQTEAVNRALSDSVTLIRGPPGCGKTAVIVVIAHYALRQKVGRLLICALCNVACQNIISMLAPVMNAAGKKAVWLTAQMRNFRSYANLDNVQKVTVFWHMLHRETREGNELRSLTEEGWRGDLPNDKVRRLRVLCYMLETRMSHEADVVRCTLESAAISCLGELCFQMVIVDEATQAVESASFIPIIHSATKFVLVGDQNQLGATMSGDAAIVMKQCGYRDSLF